MDRIVQIPREMSSVIPVFNGDEKLLNLFIQKCEYVIRTCRVDGNPDQDLYVYHVITSRLTGKAATLISERQDISTWTELKLALEQHFGDPRSEECIAIELETLKITNSESYLDFCNRIQHVKSTLIAKVNLIADENLKRSKAIIYDNLAMNVFLYNLPEDLLRIVRLKGCSSLKSALSIVLEEVNFLHQYNSRNKMLKSNLFQPRPQPMVNNPFTPNPNTMGLKQFFNPQPQFKFGLQPNNNTQQQFKFGITPSKQHKIPQQQNQPQFGYKPQPNPQFGYRPQVNQQFGYRPQLNNQQFGYRPQLNQQQFGYRPQLNQPQQFGYRPQLNNQQFGYKPPTHQPTDVTMRTLPQRPQGFKLNELYYLDEPEISEYQEYPEYFPQDQYDFEQPNYSEYPETCDDQEYEHPAIEQNEPINECENFPIPASLQDKT
ncbi:uncharacterized protein LOC114352655 [Ostrinia furnacalis]|uniref:uncharacterized protein LOC114352655 n=1 Tax=Ostrinia furnacalis TaxID=93504 RepID=UPI00103D765B|nr:uncharacterized protein LOC114352655 [Ostrinia furnacalis]